MYDITQKQKIDMMMIGLETLLSNGFWKEDEEYVSADMPNGIPIMHRMKVCADTLCLKWTEELEHMIKNVILDNEYMNKRITSNV
jgi:hypothetical protein